MKRNTLIMQDDLDCGIYEWVDGERIPVEEYELRLDNQTQYNAGLYLLSNEPDLNWIFGFDAP